MWWWFVRWRLNAVKLLRIIRLNRLITIISKINNEKGDEFQ